MVSEIYVKIARYTKNIRETLLAPQVKKILRNISLSTLCNVVLSEQLNQLYLASYSLQYQGRLRTIPKFLFYDSQFKCCFYV